MLNFHIFLGAIALYVSLAAAVKGCDPSAIVGQGFDVNYYNYTHLDTAFQTDPDFYTTGYLSQGYIGSKSGVQAINFLYNAPVKVVVEGEIFGFHTTISNISMSLTGYFLATQTGSYDFSMVVDDGGFLQFGAGGSCCGNVIEDVTGDYLKAVHRSPASANFTMEAGYYYPIKIVWVNWDGPGSLNIKYTAPDGTTVSEIGSQVYKFQDRCVVSATRTWTGSNTRTVTIPGSKTNSVIVEVPTPTQTITTYWTGSKLTSTTATGSDGESNTVIIQVPTPATTVTSTWTGTVTSTSTVTGSGTNTVIIVVPSASSASSETVVSSSDTTSSTSDTISFSSDAVSSSSDVVPSSSAVSSSSEGVSTSSGISFLSVETSASSYDESPSIDASFSSQFSTGIETSLTVSSVIISSESTSETSSTQVASVHTITSTWTGSYITSSVLTGTDGSSTPVLVVPSFSPPSSHSWPGIYSNSSVETITEYASTSKGPLSSTGGHIVTSDDVSYTTETKTTVVTTCNGVGACSAATKTYTTTYCPTSSGDQPSYTTETYTTVETVSHGPESSVITTLTLTSTHCPKCEHTSDAVKTSQGVVGEISVQIKPTSLNSFTKFKESAGSATSPSVSQEHSVSTFEGGSPASSLFAAMLIAPLLAFMV